MARRRSFCGAATVALAVLGLGAARHVSAQTYLITEIAPPVGHTHTVATGLNTVGGVVGYSFSTAVNSDAFTSVLGFRWSGGTTTSIVPLAGTTAGIAYGINDLGEAVGTSFNISGASFTGMRAFLDLPSPNYSLLAGPNDIGDLGGGEARAYGINNNGYVVGDSLDAIDPVHAFLWLPTGFSSPFGPYTTPGMKDLGTLGGSTSAAYAINSLGQIVGGSATTTEPYKAFLWAPSSSAPYAAGLNNLGAIAVLADSIALGISENTVVAGQSYTGFENTSSRAIRFDHGSKTSYTPFTGGYFASANGINSFDQLAAVSTVTSTDTSQSQAMLISAGKKYNLNSLISGGQGWTLIEATAINDTGKIVGYGTKLQGDLSVPTRGFILTPNFSLAPNSGVPANMTGGTSTSTAAVNITNAVGIDVRVSLSSDNAMVHVPASVVIPKGSSTQTFTITTDGAASGSATITATLFAVSQTSTINLTPSFTPHISSFTVTPSAVLSGATVTASVTIDTPSVGTTTIPLSSSGFPNGGVPGSLPSISVANGSTTGSVGFATTSASDVSSGNIIATLNGTASAPLTVSPIVVKTVTFSPSKVVGTDSTTVKITLNTKAPAGGTLVNLSYGGGDPIAGSPPSSVTVPANSTSTTFVLTTTSPNTRSTVTVTGSVGGTTPVSGTLTVDPIGVSSIVVSPNPVSLSAGTATATVTLNRPAPTGGWSVRVSTSNAAKADFTAGPTSTAYIDVVVPATQSTINVTVYLNATGSPNIKATAPVPPSIPGALKSFTLTINP